MNLHGRPEPLFFKGFRLRFFFVGQGWRMILSLQSGMSGVLMSYVGCGRRTVLGGLCANQWVLTGASILHDSWQVHASCPLVRCHLSKKLRESLKILWLFCKSRISLTSSYFRFNGKSFVIADSGASAAQSPLFWWKEGRFARLCHQRYSWWMARGWPGPWWLTRGIFVGSWRTRN